MLAYLLGDVECHRQSQVLLHPPHRTHKHHLSHPPVAPIFEPTASPSPHPSVAAPPTSQTPHTPISYTGPWKVIYMLVTTV